MRKGMRLAALMSLSLAAAALLGGCGSKTAGETNKAEDTKEWVYVPEFIELEDENASLYNACTAGSDLYYEAYSYNDETGEYAEKIRKYSLTDGSTSDVWTASNENSEDSYSGVNINCFKALSDGGLAVVLNSYAGNEEGNYESSRLLVKYDADGSELFNINLNDLYGQDGDEIYVNKLIVDGEGRFYLFLDSSDVLLVDADGSPCGKADMSGVTDGWINNAGVGKDGKVYISAYRWDTDSGSYTLNEVDFEKKGPGASYENFVNDSNSDFAPGLDGDILAQDGTTLYEYFFDTQTKTALLDWLDSDINGSNIACYSVLEDGRILVVTNDWSTGDGNNEIALLTKTSSKEVSEKKQVVIATLSGSSAIQSAAVKFNKSNSEYHVTVKQYIDYSNWDENSISEAITNLKNDITSSNCPDIIDLDGLDVEQLADKGVFEDLNAYLEKSSVLSRDDYVETVLDAYTYNDCLVSIPSCFSLQTVVGKASEVGDRMGWTFDELMAYADEHPGAAIFDSTTQSTILYYSLLYNENSYIDWENADCHFDSDEFKKVLEFANRFPEDWEWDEDDASEPTKIQNGEVLLSNAYFYDFDQMQLYIEMFGGDVTCIGYPTSDGSAGCGLSAGNAYAITTKSAQKEGAWAFLEDFLADSDGGDFYNWGFPSNKEALNKMVEEATAVEYVYDDDGSPMLDDDGEPITIGGGGGVGYQDGWSYTYRTPTQEEVDQVLALMEVARPMGSAGDEIYNIINEEAEAYFKGQKGVDEVADIIQSRVKIYVSENS